mgnify:CR=1 FL=1
MWNYFGWDMLNIYLVFNNKCDDFFFRNLFNSMIMIIYYLQNVIFKMPSFTKFNNFSKLLLLIYQITFYSFITIIFRILTLLINNIITLNILSLQTHGFKCIFMVMDICFIGIFKYVEKIFKIIFSFYFNFNHNVGDYYDVLGIILPVIDNILNIFLCNIFNHFLCFFNCLFNCLFNRLFNRLFSFLFLVFIDKNYLSIISIFFWIWKYYISLNK